MIAGFEVRSGAVIARCGDDRSAASLEAFMEIAGRTVSDGHGATWCGTT